MADMDSTVAAPTPVVETGLQRDFTKTGAALAALQAELSVMLSRGAEDPWEEHQDRHRIDELRRRRKELLIAWASQALTWRLRGGTVELTGDATEPDRPPRPTPPAPLGSSSSQPEIYTRPRLRRPDAARSSYDDEPSPARGRRVQLDMDHDRLIELLRMLGEPTTPLDSVERVRDELSGLTAGTSNARLDEWCAYPTQVQKALVGITVARARHLQDEVDHELLPLELTGDLDRLFSTMTGYSKREQPGFVFGLQRHHHPMGLTWLADARRWWADLVDFLPEPSVLSPERALGELRRRIQAGLGEEQILAQLTVALDAGVEAEDPRLVTMMDSAYEALRQEARFKHLRKAIRDARDQDEASAAELANPDAVLPEDWPYEGLVEGRTTAVVGGPVPEEARKRLAEVFKWAEVEWVDGAHPRALEDLAERARDGEVDHVVVLRRFVGEDADRVLIPICDDNAVPVADVASGYGVKAIRGALETAFSEFAEG
ncbi:MAG: hypothetical protein GXP62_18365 [Oligoflexia bacterium]|nr:hypothetical protein [Oligoflexia bacterium]